MMVTPEIPRLKIRKMIDEHRAMANEFLKDVEKSGCDPKEIVRTSDALMGGERFILSYAINAKHTGRISPEEFEALAGKVKLIKTKFTDALPKVCSCEPLVRQV